MSRKNNQKFLFKGRFAPFIFILLALFIEGCASPPKIFMSEKQVQAAEANNRGDAAFKKGQFNRARSYYSEALRINRSMEDEDGIAINLINLSAALRKLGDFKAAHRLIEELTGASEIRFKDQYKAEGYYVGALLYLDEENHKSAGDLNDLGLELCEKIHCRLTGKMLNVKARIELGRGKLEECRDFAEDALKENRKANDEGESANSLRLLGEIDRIEKRYADAVTHLEEALRIDKKLELSLKIAADLIDLGHIFYDQGKCDQAEHYFKRAHDVAVSSPGGELTAEIALDMISRCGVAEKE